MNLRVQPRQQILKLVGKERRRVLCHCSDEGSRETRKSLYSTRIFPLQVVSVRDSNSISAIRALVSLTHPTRPGRLYTIVFLARFLHGKHVPYSIRPRYGPPQLCCTAVPGQPDAVVVTGECNGLPARHLFPHRSVTSTSPLSRHSCP